MQGPRQTGVTDVVQHHWLLGSGLLNGLHSSLQRGLGSARGLVRHLQWGHDNRSVIQMISFLLLNVMTPWGVRMGSTRGLIGVWVWCVSR